MYDSLYFNKNIDFYLELNTFIRELNYCNVLYNVSFKEHLPEDGYNRWPKHVEGYDVKLTYLYIHLLAVFIIEDYS
jgi:hypothetical protein